MVHQIFDIVFVDNVVPRVQIFQQLFNLRRIEVVECYLLCHALLFPLVQETGEVGIKTYPEFTGTCKIGTTRTYNVLMNRECLSITYDFKVTELWVFAKSSFLVSKPWQVREIELFTWE